MVAERQTFTMDAKTKDSLKAAVSLLGSGMDKSKLIRHLINSFAQMGIGRVLTYRFGYAATVIGKADPIQGDVQVLLPSVTLANGMELDMQLRIPATGMSEQQFAQTFSMNQSYIQTLVETIEREIGSG